MANPLYDELNGKIQNGYGMQPSMQEQFMQFAQQFRQSGQMSPQTIVQQLLQSGRMSPEQFQQYSQMANMLTGRR